MNFVAGGAAAMNYLLLTEKGKANRSKQGGKGETLQIRLKKNTRKRRRQQNRYSNHASDGMHDKQGNKDQDKEQ